MKCSIPLWIVIIPLATAFLSPPGHGQDSDAKADSDRWLKARQAEFQEYCFERGADEPAGRPVALTLESRSVLNWSNPERGTDQGGMFLWTDGGRPQMIACAFEWGGSLKHEFHSLSTEPIEARRGGSAVHRFGPGIEWNPLPKAPEPAAGRSQRLTQMRRQAERFEVAVGRQAAGRRDEWATARLLPQPVFRSPENAASDGAVFVFVQGTDPECVLLLEATPDKKWQYALTRQTKWALRANLDEAAIWEARPNHQPEANPETPFLVIPQPPAR
jgi:hypothetical protein